VDGIHFPGVGLSNKPFAHLQEIALLCPAVADGIHDRLDQIDPDTTAALERIIQIRERDGVKVKTLPLIVDLDAQYLIQKADAHMHGLPGITGTPVLDGVHQRLGERQVEVIGEGMAITGVVIEFMGDLLANFPYKPKILALVWNDNVQDLL
jgi:hypothetical protein